MQKLNDIRRREVQIRNRKWNQNLTAIGGSSCQKSSKKFSGEPTAWREFYETFDATVNRSRNISAVEKFSYLKGYVCGAAEKSIEGLTLTGENYEEALTILKERYGNPQLVIVSHIRQKFQRIA